MIRKIFFASALLIPILIGVAALRWPGVLWVFALVVPLIGLGLYDVAQRKHSLSRIYPIIGHGRYLLEEFRPEIQQYFVESDIDERPFSREFRSVVYQRAKGDLDTRAFGTQRDVNRTGYEWMNHSLAPRPMPTSEPRVRVGGPECTQPYLASYFNISALSFGSLSKNAILALNRAAKMGGFLHNTGEGGLSPYHLEPGGDLVWQIGTAYFGCRTSDGRFDPSRFAEYARQEAVKMIEIKLSQGAKPGHGGLLPAVKVTGEIAAIRGVPMGQDVISPPAHTAFSNPKGLLEFVSKLREISGGKPVGFKLCMGKRSEFLGICKAILETNLLPDFITVDGAEGGSGAAPLELSNSVGMPMRDGLLLAHSALRGIGVRDNIRIVAAGKLITAFHIFRAIALGADMCNSARGMMFALGCIQARRCNADTCPVGVATQDPSRVQGLDVEDKSQRVARYHRATLDGFQELVASAGLQSPHEIQPHHVLRRVDGVTTRHFGEIYPLLEDSSLLSDKEVPEAWRDDWSAAKADQF